MKALANWLRTGRKFLLVLSVVALLGLGGWGLWAWQTSGAGQVKYKTEEVKVGSLVATINASGTLVPEDVIDVGAQVAGQIVKFGKDLDNSAKDIDYRARVKVGTKLAFIDPAIYKSEVDIAKGALLTAQGEVERSEKDVKTTEERVREARANLGTARATLIQAQKDLYDAKRQRAVAPGSITNLDLNNLTKGFQSAEQMVNGANANIRALEAAVLAANATLTKAKGNVLTCQGNLEKAEQNLRYTEIKSPVDGVIIDRRVNIGQTVVSSLTAPSLFLIAKDLSKMQVWATVNEADVSRIRPGQLVYFRVDAHPSPADLFEGRVQQIRLNATMTQNVVTYTVVVTTNNEIDKDGNPKLLPYMTANLQFRVGERANVLLVPNAALRYRPQVPERIVPEHRAKYGQPRRKATALFEKVKDPSKLNRAVVWLEEGKFARPVRVRIGLTDGAHTEITEILEGELPEGARIITGEEQKRKGGGANPFAPKIFGKKN
jgi:HlyD family secretion protein